MKLARIAALFIVIATLATSCQVAKAGARCRAGSAPGRDSSHVLFCVGGKWSRVVTIGEGASIVLGRGAFGPGGNVLAIDGASEVSASQNSGNFRTPMFKVTKNGAPVEGQRIAIGAVDLPTHSESVLTTDANGQVQGWILSSAATGTFKGYAKFEGTSAQVAFSIVLQARSEATLTIVSGDNQSGTANSPFRDSLVARLTTSDGSPLVGATVSFNAANNSVTASPNPAITDANGTVSFALTAGAYSFPQVRLFSLNWSLAGYAGGNVPVSLPFSAPLG